MKMEKAPQNRLFGTDGIRELVGNFPLDDDSVLKLGHAIGAFAGGAKIVIGRDTRDSGENIEKLITAGITGAAGGTGAEVRGCGVITTPGLSFVTNHDGFDYGIMITASHNPYTDNGIKIFDRRGEKISEETEARLENIFFQTEVPRHGAAPLHRDPAGPENYLHFLSNHARDLRDELSKANLKLKVVLDCANGAAYDIAPRVFRETGMDAMTVHAAPDGKNINRECGSTHIEKLQETVKTEKAHLGISFDGDGDRVLFMDHKGRIIQGDHTLYIISKYLLETQADFNKIVVGTVMGNLGLEKALGRIGVSYTRTPVGDKYVYRRMKQQRAILGGEQSGHIILRSFQKTGDGILTALYFLKALAHLGIDPAGVFGQFVLFPQVIINIDIREKKDLDRWDRLNEMIKAFNDRHGDNSRLLIRYSGTEFKIRIMMESEHPATIDENIGKFEHFIQSTIGK